jgi:hypothetical protein
MINYEKDFYGWTQEQAALLRAGRLTELDITNLIEEVETMGRSEKRALQSRLTVLLVHLLKWRYQPDRRGRSWTLTIEGQRMEFDDVLIDNPGLKPQLSNILSNAYRMAKVNASKETNLDKELFPSDCPWTLQQIIDSEFYPD